MRYTLLVILMMLTLSSFAQEAKIEDIAPSEYYLEGVRCYNLGQFSEARELLSKAIGGNQENDAAYYYLALSYLELQDTQAAEAYLLKAQEKDPANFWYKVKLAQFYTATGDNRKAISIYEEIARDYPAKRSIYYDIIDLYAADQQYDKALETINKIESLKGENEMTGEVKYELMIRKGDYHGAMAHLEEYYTKYPSPRVALVLGDLNKSLYRDSSAIMYYQKALSLEPDYAPAFFGLAEVYRSKMKYSEYFPYIIRFMESPEMKVDFKTRYMKEVVMNPHFVRQYMNEVDAMANSIVNAHPQDTASFYTIGAYYIQTGRDTLGKLLFKGAVESHPNDERANREYISLLYYMKEWEELAEQCERALFHFPEDLSIMEIRPVAYWQSGDSDKAISLYNELISNLPKRDTTAYLYYASLGDIYHEKGDLKRAYSHYEKALRINPDYNPSLNNYAYYMCLEGKNLKKAAKMSLKTITSEPDNPTYLDTYAWILYRMGEFSEAKTHIKRAMFYSGNEDATLLDHYAEILYALKEYDLAFIYWEQADKKDPSLGIGEKIKERKLQMKR